MKEYSNFAMKFLTQPRVMINETEKSKIYKVLLNEITRDISLVYDDISVDVDAIEKDDRFDICMFKNTDESLNIKNIAALKYNDKIILIKPDSIHKFILDVDLYNTVLYTIINESLVVKKKSKKRNTECYNSIWVRPRYRMTITPDSDFTYESTDINNLYGKCALITEFYSFIPEIISTNKDAIVDFWTLFDKEKYDADNRIVIKYTSYTTSKIEGMIFFDGSPVLAFIFIGHLQNDFSTTHMYEFSEFGSSKKINEVLYFKMIVYLQSLKINNTEIVNIIKNKQEAYVLSSILRIKSEYVFNDTKYKSLRDIMKYMNKTTNDVLNAFNEDETNITKPFIDFFMEYIIKDGFKFKNKYFPSLEYLCNQLDIPSKKLISNKEIINDDDILDYIRTYTIPRYKKYGRKYNKLELIENTNMDSYFILPNEKLSDKSIDDMCDDIASKYGVFINLNELDTSMEDKLKVRIAKNMSIILQNLSDITTENTENIMKGMMNNMTPSELLNKGKVVSISSDFSLLIGAHYNHIPELIPNYSDRRYESFWTMYDKNKYLKDYFIKIEFYANKNLSPRYIWRLGVVKFKDKPVMIIQNAGREGDDYSKRFILTEKIYQEMIDYMNSLYIFKKYDIPKFDIISDLYFTEMPELTEFYGHTLETINKK